jgi:hypothetical protein
MRFAACILAVTALLTVQPAMAQWDAKAFWGSVQSRCDATAAKPAGETGKRIARLAIDEFYRFGGHEIDADGRLFRFGQTEAEHEPEHGEKRPARLGDLGWWRVKEYWRALYGPDFADKLEARGYRDAVAATDAAQTARPLRPHVADVLRAADGVSDPVLREVLREAALRAAIIDTPWSAAFISYIVRQAGVSAEAFEFANAHRAYIYDAFAVSAAEVDGKDSTRSYRACPVFTTRPRVGDLICFQREPALAGKSEAEMREIIRGEVADQTKARSVRQTHCDVVASVDAAAHKLYVIGGNVEQSVTVKKLNLRRGLKVSTRQKRNCGGPGHWTLPRPSEAAGAEAAGRDNCSLIDKKWFVLLQMR